MSKLVDLGTVAVLDADKLSIGDRITIDDQILYVSRIEGPNVILTPISGWELFKHRISKYSTPLIVVGILVVCAVVGWLNIK